MVFQLEVLEGPHKGQFFQLREGTEIGRVRGQILLKQDTKVSSFHAVVEMDELSQLVLVDQDSSNGIKVDGKRHKRLVLKDGMIIQLGRSFFFVKELSSEEVIQKEQERPKSWKEILIEEAQNLTGGKFIPNPSLLPFQNALRLSFVEGIQTQESFYIGFGPREFGSDTLDFILQEALCPAVAFRIAPIGKGAFFSTGFPTLVQVNGSAEAEKELFDGDMIRIGQTLIRVEFE